MNKIIKTWQERTGNHNWRAGSKRHAFDEISDLRAYIAELESRVTYLTGFDSAIWLWNDKINQHVLAVPLNGESRPTLVCPTCGGSKVDPGGLPVCRDCRPAAPVVAEGLIEAKLAEFEHNWALSGDDRAMLRDFAALLAAHPVAGSPANSPLLQAWSNYIIELEQKVAALESVAGSPAEATRKRIGATTGALASALGLAEPMPASDAPDCETCAYAESTNDDREMFCHLHVKNVTGPCAEYQGVFIDSTCTAKPVPASEAPYGYAMMRDGIMQGHAGNKAIADSWVNATAVPLAPSAAPVPASETLSETQAYRTGYGAGVRKAAQMMDDRDRPVMAELIRKLQSTGVPASEAASGFKLLTLHEKQAIQRKLINAGTYDYVNYGAEIERLTLQRAGFFAAPAAPTDAKPTADLTDVLTTMLWLYRRLPRAYGRSPLSERAITALANQLGEEVENFFSERDAAQSVRDAAQPTKNEGSDQ